jgi:hypothetical protein
MAETPKEKPDKPNWADDQRERGYYYDDAHGYEKYDPADESDEEPSASRPLDVDLDRTPPLLVEPEEAQEEPCDMPDEDRDPDMDRPQRSGLLNNKADADR